MTSLEELKLLKREDLLELMKTHYAKLFKQPMDAKLQAHFFDLAQALHDKAPAKKNGTRRVPFVKALGGPSGGPSGEPSGGPSGGPLDGSSGGPSGGPLPTIARHHFFSRHIDLTGKIIPGEPTWVVVFNDVDESTEIVVLDKTVVDQILAIKSHNENIKVNFNYEAFKNGSYYYTRPTDDESGRLIPLYKLIKTKLTRDNFDRVKQLMSTGFDGHRFISLLNLFFDDSSNKFFYITTNMLRNIENLIASGEVKQQLEDKNSVYAVHPDGTDKLVEDKKSVYLAINAETFELEIGTETFPIVFFEPMRWSSSEDEEEEDEDEDEDEEAEILKPFKGLLLETLPEELSVCELWTSTKFSVLLLGLIEDKNTQPDEFELLQHFKDKRTVRIQLWIEKGREIEPLTDSSIGNHLLNSVQKLLEENAITDDIEVEVPRFPSNVFERDKFIFEAMNRCVNIFKENDSFNEIVQELKNKLGTYPYTAFPTMTFRIFLDFIGTKSDQFETMLRFEKEDGTTYFREICNNVFKNLFGAYNTQSNIESFVCFCLDIITEVFTFYQIDGQDDKKNQVYCARISKIDIFREILKDQQFKLSFKTLK